MEKTRKFDSPEGFEDFAKEIRMKLLKAYEAEGGKFCDGEELSDEGMISIGTGLLSLLLLGIGFEMELDEGSKSVFDQEIEKLLGLIKSKSYHPNLTKNKKKPFSKENGLVYMESVGLVFSVCILSKYAASQGFLDIDQNTEDKLQEALVQTADIIIKGAVEGGGWGFAETSTQADLYFTYTIAEVLGDYGDYVLGESKEAGIDPDPDMEEWLGPKKIKDFERIRSDAASWLKSAFVLENPDDPEKALLGQKPVGLNYVTEEQEWDSSCESAPFCIGKKNSFISLYYSYYVMISLILTGADEVDGDDEGNKRVSAAIEHGIYLSRMQYDIAKNTKTWWDSKKKSTLYIKLVDPKINEGIEIETVRDPNLIPLALRCNLLYSFYIAKGKDTKIEKIFESILADRTLEDEKDETGVAGLWDSQGYNLLITERAIESLIDYYDYCKKYVFSESAPGASGSTKSMSIAAQTSGSIDALIDARIQAALVKSPALQEQSAQTANIFSRKEIETMLNEFLRDTRILLQGKTATEKFSEEFSMENCNDFIKIMGTFFNSFVVRSLAKGNNSGRSTKAKLEKIEKDRIPKLQLDIKQLLVNARAAAEEHTDAEGPSLARMFDTLKEDAAQAIKQEEGGN